MHKHRRNSDQNTGGGGITQEDLSIRYKWDKNIKGNRLWRCGMD
jgi:hypothetical protein